MVFFERDFQGPRLQHLVCQELLELRVFSLQIAQPLPEQTREFFGRPFQVIALHGFAEALCERIDDPEVKALAGETLIGSIDLISDNVDLVANGRFRVALRKLYEIGV